MCQYRQFFCAQVFTLQKKTRFFYFTLAYACEHKVGYTMVCPSAHYINILYAMYGRLEQDICHPNPVPSGGCRAADSLQKAQNYISSKCGTMPSTCTIEASNGIFGNPCGTNVKYLHLIYSCFPRLVISGIQAFFIHHSERIFTNASLILNV